MSIFFIVDSQCHVSSSWYEPVETLLDQMGRYQVRQAVLIQMLGQIDNSYQQRCMARFPGRFSSVVLVDPSAPNATEDLRQLANEGAAGVRLRPSARSPGRDPLEIWRVASECGLAVSCVGNSVAFLDSGFADLIESLPNLTIVLEHLGGTSQPDADEQGRAQRMRVCELARFPNVYMKVPGLGELRPRVQPLAATGPFDGGCPRVLEEAVRAFGAERLMWGSDFPPVGSREGYGNALGYCLEALANLSTTARAEIFGAVARRVFKLPTQGVAQP